MKSTGLPLVAGGLMDQPHLWILQWELVESVVAVYKALDKQSEGMAPAKNLMAPQRFGR